MMYCRRYRAGLSGTKGSYPLNATAAVSPRCTRLSVKPYGHSFQCILVRAISVRIPASQVSGMVRTSSEMRLIKMNTSELSLPLARGWDADGQLKPLIIDHFLQVIFSNMMPSRLLISHWENTSKAHLIQENRTPPRTLRRPGDHTVCNLTTIRSLTRNIV